MSVTRNYIIVRISKVEKDKKPITKGNILIPETFRFMKYNLQWGRVMEIGKVAARNYPEMQVGDTALFHHTIEDGPDRLLRKENNGDELRYLDGADLNHSFEVYAIVKPDGKMIVSRHFVVVSQKIRPLIPQVKSLVDDWEIVDWTQFNEDQYLTDKIKKLEKDVEQISEGLQPYYDNPALLKGMPDKTFYELEKTANAIISIRKEMHELTRYRNSRKIYSTTVMDLHPDTAKEEGIAVNDRIALDKDIIYSIEHLETHYLFVNRYAVEWKYNQ